MKLRLEDFEDLLENPRRYDTYIAASCCYHSPDIHPSLLVFDDGFFRCLSCGATGKFEYLYETLKGRPPRRSPTEKAVWSVPKLSIVREENESLAMSAHNVLVEYENLRWYLQERGLDGRIETCKLGWLNGWVTIPIYGQDGKFQGLCLRAMAHVQRATGQRFAQPKGQKPLLFVPDWKLLDRSKTLAVTFGLFDALALSDLRYAVCTSTGGKDSFQSEWLDFWRGPIVIFPDKGEESDAMELCSKLDWRGKVHFLDYGFDLKDPADFLWRGARRELEYQLARVLA